MLRRAAREQVQHGGAGEWMEWLESGCVGCLDVWVSGQVARAVDATPDCRNVKTSGIRRLSLTRDMRHGRFGVGGLCAAFRDVLRCAVMWSG